MAKHSAEEYWKQKHDKVVKEFGLEIERGNLLHGLYLLRLQRDIGCNATGAVCGDECSCRTILEQDMNSFKNMQKGKVG